MVDRTSIELLEKVISINGHYQQKVQETGEQFNVFKLLRLESHEVRTHSTFLAELLNPKGSHGVGSVFLELFLQELKVEDFECENVFVSVEKYIGPINHDKTEGGRIDIYITNGSQQGIMIENKIYAMDQQNQLLRYHHYGKKRHKGSAYLFYLTLDGAEPSEWGTGDPALMRNAYHCISYETQVLQWLENCLERTGKNTDLAVIIRQYMHLLKYLAGKTINEEMENELVKEMMRSEEHIAAAFAVSASLFKMKDELMKQFKKGIIQKLDQPGIVFDEHFGRKSTGFSYQKKEWKHGKIRFEFYRDHSMFFYAIKYQDWEKVPAQLTALIKQEDPAKNKSTFEEEWPWWDYVEDCGYAFDAQKFLDIKSGKTPLYDEIKNNFDFLYQLIEKTEKNLLEPVPEQ